jgi:hypothetical protein
MPAAAAAAAAAGVIASAAAVEAPLAVVSHQAKCCLCQWHDDGCQHLGTCVGPRESARGAGAAKALSICCSSRSKSPKVPAAAAEAQLVLVPCRAVCELNWLAAAAVSK